MKQLLLIVTFILGTVFMSACSNKPDNEVHNSKQEEAGWVVEKAGENPVMKYEDYYLISPTWGQAIHYAKKSDGFWVVTIFGLLLLVVGFFLLYGKATDAKWISESADKFIIYIAFLLFVAGFYSIYSMPGEIKWNNDKWVKKEVYNKALLETESTQPIWDSLEINNLIIGKK